MYLATGIPAWLHKFQQDTDHSTREIILYKRNNHPTIEQTH
jgi:hypothetical protein